MLCFFGHHFIKATSHSKARVCVCYNDFLMGTGVLGTLLSVMLKNTLTHDKITVTPTLERFNAYTQTQAKERACFTSMMSLTSGVQRESW